VSVVLVRTLLKSFVLRKMAAYESKRRALDAAIEKEGAFMIVMLLRLSPAMPLAPANALLGLTSVGLLPYTLGTLARPLGLGPKPHDRPPTMVALTTSLRCGPDG